MRWWPRLRPNDRTPGTSREAEARDERLSAFLDDDLTLQERGALERELEGDAALRDALAGMRAVTSSLGTLGPVAAPRPFTLEAPPVTSRRPRILDLGLQLGAAVSALLLVVAIINPGGGDGFGRGADDNSATELSQVTQSSLGGAGDPSADAAGGGAVAQSAPEAAPPSGGGSGSLAAPAPAPGESDNAGAPSEEPTGPRPQTGVEATPQTSEGLTPETPSRGASGTDGADDPPPATPQLAPTAVTEDEEPPPADTGRPAPDEGSVRDTPDTPGSDADAADAADDNAATSGGGAGATDNGAATTVEPLAPGTAQALAASNTSDGGDSDSLVPALAVLTALLAGLAVLRWTQTRRNA